MKIRLLLGLSALVLLRKPHYVSAFSTSFPVLSECQPATVTWGGSGATPPFEFIVAPINSTEPKIIQIPNNAATWNAQARTGSYTFDSLDLAAGAQYIASMSDGNGHGTGGVTRILSVTPSSNSTCNPSTRSKARLFKPQNFPSQCEEWIISWDASQLEDTVRLRGFVPGGTAFFLDPPIPGKNSTGWTVNAAKGTQFMLLYSTGGREGTDTPVETSELFTVFGDENSPTSCFLDINPSSTIAPSATSATPSALVTPGVNIGGGNQVGTSKNGNSSQVGPIVGGIIGGIAATLLIIGLIILWRRRHRDLRKDSFENHSGGADIRARPYDLSDNTFAMSGPFSSGVMQDSHISLSASQPISPVGTKGRNPISARASSEGLLQHQSNTSSSGSAEPTEEYIRARDAGPVPVASAPNRTRVVELPPLYQDIAGGKRT